MRFGRFQRGDASRLPGFCIMPSLSFSLVIFPVFDIRRQVLNTLIIVIVKELKMLRSQSYLAP